MSLVILFIVCTKVLSSLLLVYLFLFSSSPSSSSFLSLLLIPFLSSSTSPSTASIYQEPLLFLAGLLPDHFIIPPMKAPLPEDESVCLFCIGKLIAVMDKHVQDSNSDISLATMTAFLLALQRNFGEENNSDNEIIGKEAHDMTPFEADIGGAGLVVESGLSGVHVVHEVVEGIQSTDLIIAPDVLPDQSDREGANAEHGAACVGVFDDHEVQAKARTRTDDELRIAFGLPVHEHAVNEATEGIHESDLQKIEKEIEEEIENESVLTNAVEVEVKMCTGPSCALPEPIPVKIETSDVIVGEVKTADSAVQELTSAASVDPLRSMVHLIPAVMITLLIFVFSACLL
jgi:hypothetical protein